MFPWDEEAVTADPPNSSYHRNIKGKGYRKMKKGIMALLLIIILVGVSAPQLLHADMEWRVIKELELKDQPLDMVNALDGKTIFILVPGEVLVQDMESNDISQRIPVGKEFDKLAYSPRNNTLILSSSTAKTLKIIQLERILQFDYSGLPYLGSKNAPVTIAVFSDYQ
jgi:hypothetical protein